MLQQTCSLNGKTLPIIVSMHLCTHFLSDVSRAVRAATVHHHNLICKLGTLDALGDPSLLIHRQNANAQGGSIYRLHDAFHSNNPRQRPHMRATNLGEKRMTLNGNARVVVKISCLCKRLAACKDSCLFKKISFDCAW